MAARTLFAATTLLGAALCNNVHKISSADELIEFSRSVNTGTNYSGATVFLEKSIVFTEAQSQSFEPIGKNESHSFMGTFDGKGNVISNLTINAKFQYAGLFGYSTGTTIKNVVLDGTCTVTNDCELGDDQVFAGGIIGICQSDMNECNIVNNVNMANVTVRGSAHAYYIGGIIGALLSVKYGVVTANCVNYGAVFDYAKENFTFIGGIVGSPQEDAESTLVAYVQNCLNYGDLANKEDSVKARIGGIAGLNLYSRLDNCVNFGGISHNTSNENSYAGGISGYSDSSNVSHCYWSKSVSEKYYGFDYITVEKDNYYFGELLELKESVTIGDYKWSSLVDVLNAAADYYDLRDYAHWVLNNNGTNISFAFNGAEASFTVDSHVVLLPELANMEGLEFDGWYTDEHYTEQLEDYAIDDDELLYGRWKENNNYYTVKFITQSGVSVEDKTGRFGSVLELRTDIHRNEHKFLWWENEHGDRVSTSFVVPARNTTLTAAWVSNHIKNIDDFLDFSRRVYYGTNYYGTTVFLDNDLDFAGVQPGEFKFFGENIYNYFRGEFEGYGNVISNLAVDSDSQYTGLFGYSTELTIKNLVLDESCSITSNYKSAEGENVFTGGIIGSCESNEGQCKVESIVNMARVTANEEMAEASFVGGIAGALLSYNNPSILKNCINYGAVNSVGTSEYLFIGGIVGSPQKDETSNTTVYIQNCINYGSIVVDGKTNYARVGGISGLCVSNILENCVSSGVIITTGKAGENDYVGGITGYCSGSTISHCLWTKDTGYENMAGREDGAIVDSNTSCVEGFTKAIRDELSRYAKAEGFMEMFMLNLHGGRINNIGQNALVAILKQFMDPVKEGNTFLHWCKDYDCTEKYVPKRSGNPEKDDLYARWETITITFDPRNGDESAITERSGDMYNKKYGALPETPVKEGHTFIGWFTTEDGEDEGYRITQESNVAIARDHTIYGHWSANNYAVRFDFENGTVVERVFAYNSTIEAPDEHTGSKCKFGGWNSSSITFMPGRNITAVQVWFCKPASIGNGPTAAIVICTVLAVVIAVVVVLLVMIRRRGKKGGNAEYVRVGRGRKNRTSVALFSRKARGDRVSMRSRSYGDDDGDDDDDIDFITDSARVYTGVFPDDYEAPSLYDALLDAGLDDEKVSVILKACKRTGESANVTHVDGFTPDDATAIAMYTYSFGERDYEDNPYNLINSALLDNDIRALQDVGGVLYHVMNSLRKLPRYSGKTLYRGMRESIDKRLYTAGNIVVWHEITSTSTEINVVKTSLETREWEDNREYKKARGTLFIIESGWGYDVQPYSVFPDEEEILLEPEREFKVENVIEAGATIVKLRMLETPLILPEIFGSPRYK